jgi:spore coat protein U-like protein
MGRPAAVLLLAALPLLGGPARVHAQAAATASLLATARIDNTAVTVGQLNNLNFGVVVPGTPSTVAPKTALAGKFVIHGSKNAEVRVTFALPTVLQTGAFSMPISFADDPVAGRMGCHRNQDQQSNCTAYTPSTALLFRIRNNPPPQNTYYVWIGGKVSPALGQRAGTYTGTVTLTAVYTGN